MSKQPFLLKTLEECRIGFPILPGPVMKAFYWATFLFLLLNSLLLVGILVPNDGLLSFVLDDPFIHLRLAENIWLGHYGINLSEASAPSSSIIWPYVLSPFAGLVFAPWLLLLFNILMGVGLIYFVAACLAINFSALSSQLLTAVLFSFVLLANLPSLVFVGMEHVLQVLLTVIIVYGLLNFLCKTENSHTTRLKYWFWLALFLSPLVRYENSLLVGCVLLFLFVQGFYWPSLLTGLFIAFVLLSFSGYLYSLGLGWLPTSILLKSSADLPLLEKLANKVNGLIVTPKAWLLMLALGLFIRIIFSKRAQLERQLAACFALFTLLFLCLGSFGWYYRYEVFAWISVALVLLYLYRKLAMDFISRGSKQRKLAVLLILFLSIEHIFVTLLVPVAANNIYLQQYQMGRFVRDFYQAPVAVNDIGWVAYIGEQHTLDLWGLASQTAMNLRLSSDKQDGEWMQSLVESSDVGLAMIYFDDQGDADGWFESVPVSWQRLGSLTMQAGGVSVSKREVVFFSTNTEAHKRAVDSLALFAQTLPKLARFEVYTRY